MAFSGMVFIQSACTQGASLPVEDKLSIMPGFANLPDDGPTEPDFSDLKQKVAEAKKYCRQNGLNEEVALLVDLGMHSATYRFFVVRLSDGAIRYRGLVAHGSGKKWMEAGFREYSNTSGSLLSSLGKYKTGKSYQGQFGLAYKLHGLEASNSNAYSRAIVLHAHECVPDLPFKGVLCQSWGCPTVSVNFLKSLQKLIDLSPQPLLLWIYDSSSIP